MRSWETCWEKCSLPALSRHTSHQFTFSNTYFFSAVFVIFLEVSFPYEKKNCWLLFMLFSVFGLGITDCQKVRLEREYGDYRQYCVESSSPIGLGLWSFDIYTAPARHRRVFWSLLRNSKFGDVFLYVLEIPKWIKVPEEVIAIWMTCEKMRFLRNRSAHSESSEFNYHATSVLFWVKESILRLHTHDYILTDNSWLSRKRRQCIVLRFIWVFKGGDV